MEDKTSVIVARIRALLEEIEDDESEKEEKDEEEEDEKPTAKKKKSSKKKEGKDGDLKDRIEIIRAKL